eukprot:124004-Amphidinium_carterae.1
MRAASTPAERQTTPIAMYTYRIRIPSFCQAYPEIKKQLTAGQRATVPAYVHAGAPSANVFFPLVSERVPALSLRSFPGLVTPDTQSGDLKA